MVFCEGSLEGGASTRYWCVVSGPDLKISKKSLLAKLNAYHELIIVLQQKRPTRCVECDVRLLRFDLQVLQAELELKVST